MISCRIFYVGLLQKRNVDRYSFLIRSRFLPFFTRNRLWRGDCLCAWPVTSAWTVSVGDWRWPSLWKSFLCWILLLVWIWIGIDRLVWKRPDFTRQWRWSLLWNWFPVCLWFRLFVWIEIFWVFRIIIQNLLRKGMHACARLWAILAVQWRWPLFWKRFLVRLWFRLFVRFWSGTFWILRIFIQKYTRLWAWFWTRFGSFTCQRRRSRFWIIIQIWEVLLNLRAFIQI